MSVHDCVPSFDPLPMHFRLRCVSALASGAVYVSICGLQDAQDCLGMLYCSLAEIPSCINRLLTSNSIKRDIIGENFQENLLNIEPSDHQTWKIRGRSKILDHLARSFTCSPGRPNPFKAWPSRVAGRNPIANRCISNR